MGKLRSGQRYNIEPDMIGDGDEGSVFGSDLAASEIDAIAEFTGASGEKLSPQQVRHFTQLANSFNWTSRARNYIMDGLKQNKRDFG
jgi:hypothetical protein